jgi:hypothetical protein
MSRDRMKPVYQQEEDGSYTFIGYDHIPELYPGLWFVRGNETGTGIGMITNMIFRMSDVPDPVDIQDLVKCEVLADLITDELAAWQREGKLQSVSDAGRHIANEVYKKIAEEKAGLRELDSYLSK